MKDIPISKNYLICGRKFGVILNQFALVHLADTFLIAVD